MQTKFDPKEKVYITGTVESIVINDCIERYAIRIKNGGDNIKITADAKDIIPINEDKHTAVFTAGDVIVRADTLGEDFPPEINPNNWYDADGKCRTTYVPREKNDKI